VHDDVHLLHASKDGATTTTVTTVNKPYDLAQNADWLVWLEKTGLVRMHK
jgi:hypothetical protein